jgi:hypothetical protein
MTNEAMSPLRRRMIEDMLRLNAHRLHFLPQPALPEVPVAGRPGLA